MTGDADTWHLAEKVGAGKEYLSGKDDGAGHRDAIPDQQLAAIQKPCSLDAGAHIGECVSAGGKIELPQLNGGTYEFLIR